MPCLSSEISSTALYTLCAFCQPTAHSSSRTKNQLAIRLRPFSESSCCCCCWDPPHMLQSASINLPKKEKEDHPFNMLEAQNGHQREKNKKRKRKTKKKNK